MLLSRGALLFFKVIREILRAHSKKKIIDFDPKWAFLDCNPSLNSPMATEWCKKLVIAWKRCPFVFQGHLSNFKVTQLKNIFVNKVSETDGRTHRGLDGRTDRSVLRLSCLVTAKKILKCFIVYWKLCIRNTLCTFNEFALQWVPRNSR